MSAIVRKTASIFGSAAGLDQIAEFGSLAANAPAYSTDPAVIQSLSAWTEGWFGAILGNNNPCIEDINATSFVLAYQIAYLCQRGIPEWDAGTTYYIGCMVNSGGVIYVSLQNSNLNQAVSVAAYWAPQSSVTTVNLNPSAVPTYVMTAANNTQTLLVNSANGAQAITLPAPTAGFTITVKDSGGAAQTSNITINHNASETIDGAASYVMTFNYGYVKLVSDGTNWFVADQSTAITPWVTYSLVIGAGTAPTPGSGYTQTCFWRRVGDSIEMQYTYRQSNAGSAGSGTYLFPLPNSWTFATTKIAGYGGASGVGQSQGTGSGFDTSSANQLPLTAFVASTTAFALYCSSFPSTGTTVVGSSYSNLGESDTAFGFIATAPVTGWGMH